MESEFNFNRLIQPAPRTAVFCMEGWYVWCPTVVRTKDGQYHMLFSRWPKESGFRGWVTHSEVGYATADDALGPFTFRKVVLKGSGHGHWDADVVHNPTMLEMDGKYYVYYMGNKGNGEWWDHRNHQRIGAAVADHPSGPWRRLDAPVLDVSPGRWDHLLVSNPTVARSPGGGVIMVYKGVGEGPPPKGGAVVCGVACADHPLGPFRKEGGPIMVNPENDWSVEDPYIWCQDGRIYAIVKDFQGYFTRTGGSSVALFESRDGMDWKPSANPLAFKREIGWEDGTVEKVEALERPQLLLEDGVPSVLYCAARVSVDRETFNIAIPLSSRG